SWLHFDGERPDDDRSAANSSHPHTVALLFDEIGHHNCVASSRGYICSHTNNIDSVGSPMDSCQLCAAFLRCRILDISSHNFTHSFATPHKQQKSDMQSCSRIDR